MIVPFGLPVAAASRAYSAFPPASEDSPPMATSMSAVSAGMPYPVQCDAADAHVGIADDAERAVVQATRDIGGKCAQCRRRQDIEARVTGRGVLGPPERAGRPCDERIRPHRMRVIVKPPDDQPAGRNEALLRLIRGVRLEPGEEVLVVVERRLVCDDEVPAVCGCPLEHVEGRHAGGRDAAHRSPWLTSLEGVARLLAPLNALRRQLLLDATDELLPGHTAGPQ